MILGLKEKGGEKKGEKREANSQRPGLEHSSHHLLPPLLQLAEPVREVEKKGGKEVVYTSTSLLLSLLHCHGREGRENRQSHALDNKHLHFIFLPFLI